eukprot:7811420-Lingulodinium_polyedra.AAC.1
MVQELLWAGQPATACGAPHRAHTSGARNGGRRHTGGRGSWGATGPAVQHSEPSMRCAENRKSGA